MISRDEFKLIYKDPKLSADEWQTAWLKMRMGRFGGSEAHRVMSTSKSTGLETYAREKVAEIVTGDREGVFTNQYMEHGNNFELSAAKEYMERTDSILMLDTYCTIGEHLGSSSDGIETYKERVAEIKCPMFKTHLKYLTIENGKDLLKISKAYYTQCQMNMWALDFKFCDFITYYPPSYLDHPVTHYKCIEIERDEDYIQNLLARLELAIKYKTDLLKKIGYKNEK